MPSELFQAIDRHDVAKLSTLLSQGADPNQALDEPPFWQPLEASIEAVEHGAPTEVVMRMVKLLIEHGADVNAWDQEKNLTPILKALYFPIVDPPGIPGSSDLVRLVIDAGADPNVESQEGWTPLKWAIARADQDLVSTILNRGVVQTINKAGGLCGCTPLQFAAGKLNVPIMRLLLKAGANPNAPDVDRRIALQHLPARNPTNQRAWDMAYELLTGHSVQASR